MKVFVIGSSRTSGATGLPGLEETPGDQAAEGRATLHPQKDQIEQAARAVGEALATAGHTIWIGTDDDVDVDPHVVEGALSVEPPVEIEVQRQHGWSAAYVDKPNRIGTRWRQFDDWDVTNMEVVREVDGVIAIAGRASVVQMGIAAWMMNKPVIPIGSFGGGAKTLWNYGSARRSDFYQDGLVDAVIDRLAAPWSNETAKVVVDALNKVEQARARARVPRALLVFTLLLTLVALIGWVFFLMYPILAADTATATAAIDISLFALFPTVGFAGLLGANMQTLRAIRNAVTVSGRAVPVDIALGITAGVISAVLYLLVQFAVSGDIMLQMNAADYVRVALIVSMASLFAALYLDRALARFDTISDSVISGKYEG